jgi:BlaI family transcriptional regulator, penicillinase repressor
MKQIPAISEAEWEIMKALWEHSPVRVTDLTAELAPAKKWHPKTVRTMLNRLRRKGAVNHRIVDGVYHYYPAVSQENCTRRAAESFIDRVFGGAVTPMVAQLVRRRPLTAEEKRELRKILDES